MKFEIRYDPEKRGIYATRATVVLISVVVATILVLGGLTVYRLNQSAQKLQTPEDKNKPLSLGVAPVAPKTLPPNKNAAAGVVISELKKTHGRKFNIIFFYDGYQNQQDALLDIKVMQETLKSVEPFASLQDIITTKTMTSEGQKCQVQSGAKKLLVCDKEFVQSFNRLGIEHFKLVVLSPLDFVPAATIARGKNSAIYISTFKEVLTHGELNKFIGRFFIHELGHSLGLRDEYSRQRPAASIIDKELALALSSNKAYQPAAPNCAPDEATAKSWWGEYIGVFKGVDIYPGCAGRDTYFYPQKGTLMSDNPQKEEFGRVSEDYLRGAISCFFAGKESLIWPAGLEATYSAKLKNCDSFKKDFSGFWNE